MRLRSIERPRFRGTAPIRWHHPNEGPHNRLVYRLMGEALTYAGSRYAQGRLVDIGCGSKGWKRLFAQFVDEHVGVDHVPSARDVSAVDVIASAYEVPLEDGYADTVLLTAVLEHLEQPERAIAECRRLLKPGGYLIMTAPFFWHLHDEPRDFFRYSPHGLRYLLESGGLDVVELQPLAGVWTTISLEFSYAIRRYRRRGLTPIAEGLMAASQWLAARWEQVDFQPSFSWSHLVVARRPDEGHEPRPIDSSPPT